MAVLHLRQDYHVEIPNKSRKFDEKHPANAGNVMEESEGNETSLSFLLCVHLSVHALALPLSRFNEFLITLLTQGGEVGGWSS